MEKSGLSHYVWGFLSSESIAHLGKLDTDPKAYNFLLQDTQFFQKMQEYIKVSPPSALAISQLRERIHILRLVAGLEGNRRFEDTANVLEGQYEKLLDEKDDTEKFKYIPINNRFNSKWLTDYRNCLILWNKSQAFAKNLKETCPQTYFVLDNKETLFIYLSPQAFDLVINIKNQLTRWQEAIDQDYGYIKLPSHYKEPHLLTKILKTKYEKPLNLEAFSHQLQSDQEDKLELTFYQVKRRVQLLTGIALLKERRKYLTTADKLISMAKGKTTKASNFPDLVQAEEVLQKTRDIFSSREKKWVVNWLRRVKPQIESDRDSINFFENELKIPIKSFDKCLLDAAIPFYNQIKKINSIYLQLTSNVSKYSRDFPLVKEESSSNIQRSDIQHYPMEYYGSTMNIPTKGNQVILFRTKPILTWAKAKSAKSSDSEDSSQTSDYFCYSFSEDSSGIERKEKTRTPKNENSPKTNFSGERAKAFSQRPTKKLVRYESILNLGLKPIGSELGLRLPCESELSTPRTSDSSNYSGFYSPRVAPPLSPTEPPEESPRLLASDRDRSLPQTPEDEFEYFPFHHNNHEVGYKDNGDIDFKVCKESAEEIFQKAEDKKALQEEDYLKWLETKYGPIYIDFYKTSQNPKFSLVDFANTYFPKNKLDYDEKLKKLKHKKRNAELKKSIKKSSSFTEKERAWWEEFSFYQYLKESHPEILHSHAACFHYSKEKHPVVLQPEKQAVMPQPEKPPALLQSEKKLTTPIQARNLCNNLEICTDRELVQLVKKNYPAVWEDFQNTKKTDDPRLKKSEGLISTIRRSSHGSLRGFIPEVPSTKIKTLELWK